MEGLRYASGLSLALCIAAALLGAASAQGDGTPSHCELHDYQFIPMYTERGNDLYSDTEAWASGKKMGLEYKVSVMASRCENRHGCVAFDSLYNFKLRIRSKNIADFKTNGVHLNDTRLVANECRGIWLSKSRDQALSRSFGWKQDPSVTISQKDQRESNMAEYLKLEGWVGMLRSGAASKQMVQALAGPRYWPSVEALHGGGKFNVDVEPSYLTPVKNQGDCMSCTAYAAVATVEAALAKTTKKLYNFSESELFLCRGQQKCDAGWLPQSALQLLASSGLVDASCYALGKGCGSCPANPNAPGGVFRSRQLRTLAEVQSHIRRFGSVLTTFYVHDDFMRHWSSGTTKIYRYDQRAVTTGGHAVMCFGYDNTERYWLCKNSWGTGSGNGMLGLGIFKIGYGEDILMSTADPTLPAGIFFNVGATEPPESPEAPASATSLYKVVYDNDTHYGQYANQEVFALPQPAFIQAKAQQNVYNLMQFVVPAAFTPNYWSRIKLTISGTWVGLSSQTQDWSIFEVVSKAGDIAFELRNTGASISSPNVLVRERSTDRTQLDTSYLLTPGETFYVLVYTYSCGWKNLGVTVTLEWGNKAAAGRRRVLGEREEVEATSAAARGAGSPQSAGLPRRVLPSMSV